MALVVGDEVCAGDLAAIAQRDRDLGEIQLQGTVGEPAASKDHGQLEHLAQHARDRRDVTPG